MNKIKVGMVGGGVMAKAHSIALASMPMFFHPAPIVPERYMLADRTAELAAENAERYGYEKSTGDWKELIADEEIGAVHIVTPNNMHAEIAIAAAKAKKHILCEKPLSRTTAEAKEMLAAAEENGVVHQIAFNYRRTPAVALAKKFIEEGRIGKIFAYRGTYYGGGFDANGPIQWRHQSKYAGYGILGDLGTHALDLARYLVGEITAVSGVLETYVPFRPICAGSMERAEVDVDDAASFMVKFAQGATGSIEANCSIWGRDNYITFEIYGEKGSLVFNYNHRDELQVCFGDDEPIRRGFQIIKTGPIHPYGFGLWHCPELGIGFSEIKAVECYTFYEAIRKGKSTTPNFADGVKIAQICDAVARSSKSGHWEPTGC